MSYANKFKGQMGFVDEEQFEEEMDDRTVDLRNRLKKDDIRQNPEWDDKDEIMYTVAYANEKLLNLPLDAEEGFNDPEVLIAETYD